MANKLWQCPLKVERGSNGDMPAEWLGAFVNFYAGALTYEDALTKAVQALRQMGLVFVDLVGGKVVQLDPDLWWEGHVMGQYPDYCEWFPDQAQIAGLVHEGLVFHGPFAGWSRE